MCAAQSSVYIHGDLGNQVARTGEQELKGEKME